MTIQSIFLTQFFLSLVAWAALAALILVPWLRTRSEHDVLVVLLLPQAFRHVGLSFLVPGVVASPLPDAFAGPAAYGDLAAGLLALLALLALARRWRLATVAVWVFSVVGIADLANALRQVEAIPHFGSTWFIPTLLVPLLLISHALILWRLLQARATRAAGRVGDQAAV